MNSVGFDFIQKQEEELLAYATQELEKIEGIQFIGTAEQKVSVISFNIEGCHPYDIGTIVDKLGVAVRTGHHCTQPIMDFFKIPGTIRASFMFYNTIDDVDRLVSALKKAKMMLM
jgi:cysteine desulfurase/selenocysteine lyase